MLDAEPEVVPVVLSVALESELVTGLVTFVRLPFEVPSVPVLSVVAVELPLAVSVVVWAGP